MDKHGQNMDKLGQYMDKHGLKWTLYKKMIYSTIITYY